MSTTSLSVLILCYAGVFDSTNGVKCGQIAARVHRSRSNDPTATFVDSDKVLAGQYNAWR